MRKYIDSLFPWRWIPIIVLFGCSGFVLCALLVVNNVSRYIGAITIITWFIFWFIIDYIFGIGQECYWDRKNG